MLITDVDWDVLSSWPQMSFCIIDSNINHNKSKKKKEKGMNKLIHGNVKQIANGSYEETKAYKYVNSLLNSNLLISTWNAEVQMEMEGDYSLLSSL